MNSSELSSRDDESFLDALFDEAVRSLGEGRTLDPEAATAARPHLLLRAREVARLAGQVAVHGPAGRPRLRGYELLSELGRGAGGTVWLARQHGLDRLVAVKVLSASAAFSPRAQRRFLEEARTLARLRLPGVVAIHEVIEDGDVLAFAMDAVRGRSLAEVLRELRSSAAVPDSAELARAIGMDAPALDALSPETCFARMILSLARTLDTVHREGLVHRDVKPGNVLLTHAGEPVLTDFGLARQENSSHLTQTGQFVGTPVYAAPEQLRGDWDRVDARADVYALGATLYECLTLQPPFSGRSPVELLARIEQGRAIPLRRVNPRVSRDLATVVAKAMEPERDRRYATAGDLADDLERLLALHPIAARPTGPLRRLQRFVHRQRLPLLAGMLGAGLAGAFALGAWRHAGARDRAAAEAAEHAATARILLLTAKHLPEDHAAGEPPRDFAPELRAAAAKATFELRRSLELCPLGESVAALEAALAWWTDGPAAARNPQLPDLPLTGAASAQAAAGRPVSLPTHEVLARASSLDRRALGLWAWLADEVDLALVALAPFDLAEPADPLVDAVYGDLFLHATPYAQLAYPRLLRAREAMPDARWLDADLAQAADRLGDITAAKRFSASALAAGDDTAPAALAHAEHLAPLGSLESYETWLRQLRTGHVAMLRQAEYLLRRGDLEQAVTLLSEAAAARPENLEIVQTFAGAVDRWWDALGPAREFALVADLALEREPATSALRVRAQALEFVGGGPGITPHSADLGRLLSVVCAAGPGWPRAAPAERAVLAALALGPWAGHVAPLARAMARTIRPRAAGNEWSLEFAGTDGVLSAPYHPGMDTGFELTIEAWACRTSPAGTCDGSGIVVEKRCEVASEEDKRLDADPCRPEFTAGGCRGSRPALELEAGRWYHLAGVRSGDRESLFVNGRLAWTDEACTRGMGNWPADVLIGASSDGTRHFRGLIAAVRVSKIARYQADFVPALAWSPDDFDVLSIPLEEGSGFAAADSGPCAATATMHGAVSWSPEVPRTQVWSVQPSDGAAEGGSLVEVRGVLFGGLQDTRVSFGSAPAAILDLAFDRLLVRAPPGQAGTSVEVRVETIHGSGSATERFGYQ